MRRILISLLVIGMILVNAPISLAELLKVIPNQISVQGVMTDNDGNPLDEGKIITLKCTFYDYEDTAVKIINVSNVKIEKNGIFNAVLKELDIRFKEQYALKIEWVEGEKSLGPVPLTSVPYALAAKNVYAKGGGSVVVDNDSDVQAGLFMNDSENVPTMRVENDAPAGVGLSLKGGINIDSNDTYFANDDPYTINDSTTPITINAPVGIFKVEGTKGILGATIKNSYITSKSLIFINVRSGHHNSAYAYPFASGTNGYDSIKVMFSDVIASDSEFMFLVIN